MYLMLMKEHGMLDQICMHCLNSGNWIDEDKCPDCDAKGHISPWIVSGCPACNQEFTDAMRAINIKIKNRVRINKLLIDLGAKDITWDISSDKELLVRCRFECK